MDNQTIRKIEKLGLSISKNKLIELIKNSSQTTFAMSKITTGKEALVVVNF
jgi:hypothetical protein